MTSAAREYGQARWKLVAWGAGRAWNSSVVTTPKLPAPAPRSAQNRSSSWCSSQARMRPSARTTCAPIRWSEPASQGQARHPDRRTGATGDGEVLVLKGLVHVAQPRTCAHSRNATGDRHGPHRRDVDEHASGRGVARETVPSAAGRDLEAVSASERDRLRNVLGAGTGDDGRRPYVTEPRVERSARCVVGGRAGQGDVALDPALERIPVGHLGCHPAGTLTASRSLRRERRRRGLLLRIANGSG